MSSISAFCLRKYLKYQNLFAANQNKESFEDKYNISRGAKANFGQQRC
jgi:hypothetical protein